MTGEWPVVVTAEQAAPDRVRNVTVRGITARVSVRPGVGRLVNEPPLLLCNGIGVSLEALQPFVDQLDPERGIVRFDVPGVGGSQLPPFPYPIAGLASWVAALMTKLGHRQFDVFGLSWGGGLAQQLAVQSRKRVRRVVLVATGTGVLMVPAHPRVLRIMSTPRRHRDPAYAAKVAPEIYGGSMRSDPVKGAALLHAATRSGPKRGYYYQLAAMTGWSSLPFLGLIKQPTLVMGGDDDPIIPVVNPRMQAHLIPSARLHIYHGGHLGILTEADELAPVIDAFLDEEISHDEQLEDLGLEDSPFSDFLGFELLLEDQDRELLSNVRAFMTREVEPVINDYWTRAEFPHDLVPGIADLGIAGLAFDGPGCPARGALVDGMVAMELGRVDPSMATFMGVHGGLAMGSIQLCGSDEQRERWLPPMARMELIGAFGLTEPEHGSDISQGLATTARRDGDDWILNGEKKWIGNAAFADLVVIWARDEEDEQVKGFVVEKGTDGMTFDKQEDKIALRVVQNAEIHLADVRVPEANRLQRAESFRSTANVLRVTRMSVAWQATGCARGAFEHALRYTKQRQQFGRPIASFQMVQDLLVKMLSNVTSSTAMNVRASQLQDAGLLKDEHASLCKAHATVGMRDAVGWAREVLGGNGILLEHHVGRFVADAEAIYSYEGTREVNTLIVGRAITGEGAFA